MTRTPNSIRMLRGQAVRIKPADEIAATLDADGKLDGLLFMPEMVRYCGQQARVYRRTRKTCVEGHGMRLLDSCVLLDLPRCDGAAHDGCQRNCRFFWKEAWLDLVTDAADVDRNLQLDSEGVSRLMGSLKTRKGDRYVCQSTELMGATRHLSRWDFMHFLGEMRDGELSAWDFALIVFRTVVDRFRHRIGLRYLDALSGSKEEWTRGELELKPGEWVEVRSVEEIGRTLDQNGGNRGLKFEPDMAAYAGKRFQVDFPIERIILEQNGEMKGLRNTVALKEVACAGVCSKNCPRNNTLYWRESWLKRVEPGES